MASVALDKLPAAEKEQLAVSYAAFVLHGTGAEVNAASLNAVLAASGVKVNDALVNTLAKALKGKSVTDFFGSVGAPASSAPVAAENAKPAETKPAKVAPPPPPKV